MLFLDEAKGTTHCWFEINKLLTEDLILSVSFCSEGDILLLLLSSVNQSLFLLLLPCHIYIYIYIYGRHAVKTQLSYLLANGGTLANNYMCQPLYRPSSGCASYCKVTIQYTQSIIDNEISFLAMVNKISSSITGTVYIVQLRYSK